MRGRLSLKENHTPVPLAGALWPIIGLLNQKEYTKIDNVCTVEIEEVRVDHAYFIN